MQDTFAPRKLTPIERLMVTAGRCAVRAAPLPAELVEQIKRDLDPIRRHDFDERDPRHLFVASYLLVVAAEVVVALPDRPEALDGLNAARRLLAALWAAEATPGSQEATPEYWWQRGDMA